MEETENGRSGKIMEQERWHKAMETLNKLLSGFLQPNNHPVAFPTYMLMILIYTIACSISHLYHPPPVFSAIALLTGALATVLLLMAVLPVLGWIIFIVWVLLCAKLAWGVYAKITKKLQGTPGMEEQIEVFQQARTRQQRRPGGRERNLLEKIAQPREVLIIRGSILGILGIAFAISVYTQSQSKESQIINFWDIASYRYSFITIVIGIAYNIVALLLNLLQYYVPEIREKILFEFEFLCDKVVACLLATGASAGLGASVDLEKASAYKGENSVLIMGKAVGSFLVAAFFLAFILSLCSSRAFEERGLRPNDSSRGRQEDERNPLAHKCRLNSAG